jgi:hypothetical protein
MDRRRTTTTAALERRKRNRRAFPRWILDFPVVLRWQGQTLSCQGYEIGEGGLSVVSKKELPAEVEVEIEYRLDSHSSPVRLKGIVRYATSTLYGIEFLNLGMKDRLALVEYCEKLKTVP